MKKDINKLLKAHKQLHAWSCSASAHEFVGKLHDKVKDSDFPLQNDPASEKGGFQFESFLNGIGLTAKDTHLPPEDALKAVAEETAKERFPLISIRAGTAWHIAVAVPTDSGVGLVDPARQDFIARDSKETLKLLKETAAAVKGRDTIHLLTYRAK